MSTPFRVDGRIGRTVRRVAASPAFRRVGPKVVPPFDRFLHRVTGGRVVLSQILVPSLVLTTTGRRSGLDRQSPLACVPADGGWWVVGSNFGREQHPAWTGNLLADPRASVSYRGRDVAVVARLLDDDEKAAVWPRLVAVWPAYDDYVASSGRNIRVFRLDPEVAPSDGRPPR